MFLPHTRNKEKQNGVKFKSSRQHVKDKYYLEVYSPGIDRPLKKDKDFTANYGKKVDIQFFSPFEGEKELTGTLLSHSEADVEVKRIIKGKEEKNPIIIERKLISVIRPHIDF